MDIEESRGLVIEALKRVEHVKVSERVRVPGPEFIRGRIVDGEYRFPFSIYLEDGGAIIDFKPADVKTSQLRGAAFGVMGFLCSRLSMEGKGNGFSSEMDSSTVVVFVERIESIERVFIEAVDHIRACPWPGLRFSFPKLEGGR